MDSALQRYVKPIGPYTWNWTFEQLHSNFQDCVFGFSWRHLGWFPDSENILAHKEGLQIRLYVGFAVLKVSRTRPIWNYQSQKEN